MTEPKLSSPSPSWPRSARIRGLLLGAAIGGSIFVLGLLPTTGDEPGIPIGPGALLAGTIGGWLFGPAAIRATSTKRIALVLCAYAALATLIGDVVASAQVVYRTMPGGFTLERAVDGIGDTFTLAGFGILIMGPLIFPLALGAAMRAARSQVWSTRAVLLALVALATLFAACDPTSVPSCRPDLTVGEAQQIARDLALSGQPSNMTVVEISSSLYGDQVHADTAWTVQVDVVGKFPQPSPPGGEVSVPMHWLIDVDKCTGGARVMGQG